MTIECASTKLPECKLTWTNFDPDHIRTPTQLTVIEHGVFDRPTLSATWSPAEAAAKKMSFDQALTAIGQLFLYLKACGRDELSTTNLWAGVDKPAKT